MDGPLVPNNRLFAFLAFVLVLLNPLHLLYSAACMTDVPFGCLALGVVWSALCDRWGGAYACLVLAAGVRVEAWALVPVLPAWQFLRQKRISWLGVAVCLLVPLGWLWISYLARGDWFAFFNERVWYHAHYMDFHPSRRGFALRDAREDLDYLTMGANRVVLLASVGAFAWLLVDWLRRRKLNWDGFVVSSALFAIMGFLMLAYLTKRQPVFLPRYGLFAFVLGLPLSAWIAAQLIKRATPSWAGWIGAIAMFAATASVMQPQIPVIPKVRNDFEAHQRVAQALVRDLAERHDDASRCFSDDVAVRVLSRLPVDRFERTPAAPHETWSDLATFEKFLRDRDISYVVIMPTEDSLPVKWYPELASATPVQSGRFELISSATSSFGPGVWLYRLRD